MRHTIAASLAAGDHTAEQRQMLAVVAETCRTMQSVRCAPRLAVLAKSYAVSLRTVKNWKRAGCPFAMGKRAVLRWILATRKLARGTRRKFAGELAEFAVDIACKALKRAALAFRESRDAEAQAELAGRLCVAACGMAELPGATLARPAVAKRLLALSATGRRHGVWVE